MPTHVFSSFFTSQAARLTVVGILAAVFFARGLAQQPAIPDAPTVPNAPTLPDNAVIKEPLQSAASQEVIEERPSAQHVWIAGHWRWQEGRYAWIAGRWDTPPRANVVWVEPRWDRRGTGYVLAGGYWQETVAATNSAVVTPTNPAPMVVTQPSPAPVVASSAPPTVVIVEQAPPPPRREYIVERVSPRHVWIGGYWGWRAGRHVWIEGHWELPPRERVVWVEPRWERHSNGYVFVEGLWRDAGVSVGVGVAIGGPSREREAIIIRSAPPPLRREYVDERYRLSPRHVWMSCYWRHDGRVFVWMPGRWELPPNEHRNWEPHRWEARGGTYIFIEGHWH